MRKIKFKGRSIKDKRYWLEGGYCYKHETTYCMASDMEQPNPIHHYIAEDQMTDWNLPNQIMLYEVDPETIGQYVGLADRRGKEIYEGDILEASLDEKHPENITRVEVIWSGFGWATRQIGREGVDYLDDTDAGIWEIRGNRWNNPEMMEAEHR